MVGQFHRFIRHAMDSHNFSGEEPIEVHKFLSALKTTCDDNDIQEGAAVRLVVKYLTREAKRQSILTTSSELLASRDFPLPRKQSSFRSRLSRQRKSSLPPWQRSTAFRRVKRRMSGPLAQNPRHSTTVWKRVSENHLITRSSSARTLTSSL